MTDTCPRCGTQLLTTGASPAICPRCVLAVAVPQMQAPTTSVKGYSMIRVLGEGAMGIVYLAEEEQRPGRRVALKVIRAGMDSKQVVARFEREQQALALMDHSCIARVLGAGATEQGFPYFVMEYIEGEPITTYCDRNTLNTR